MVISMLFASIALVRALTSEEEQPSVRRELSDEEFQLEGEEIFLEGEETCAVCLETFNGEGALKLRCRSQTPCVGSTSKAEKAFEPLGMSLGHDYMGLGIV
ncbi:unnamed protein product [Symbiodinium sp. KB8]|nr:unnamed protein product [Symbiodinium sp. KB8]